MGILINKNSKILVQGITGKEGQFHSKKMIEYGTNIVCGVTPGKGGEYKFNKPVFDTVYEAIKKTNCNVSIIFVPPVFAKNAILESIYYKIPIIVCITEGIPVQDIIKIKKYIHYFNNKSILIGPNCPGIVTTGESKVGIMPNSIFRKKGKIGIISRSGTLTYEAAEQIIKHGYGISTAIGIGGDQIIGIDIKKILKMFIKDKQTEIILIIGEIGGDLEIKASKWINKFKINKTIMAFISGQSAPKGITMGHAGAIINNINETAQSKMKIMAKHGVKIINSLYEIGKKISKVLKRKKNYE